MGSMDSSRLDILIYAHDGRGLGHVSRSAAIGMALRRLYPELRVCLLTGCRQTQELIGDVGLDWIKLPAYDTIVVDGRSVGIDGPCGIDDQELGRLRARQIKQIIELYRPRLVLADHTPQGKHRELVPGLEIDTEAAPQWVLGVRGVVGSVKQAGSNLAADLYRRYYSKLLWYGDRNVLGSEHLDGLTYRYGDKPVVCGYVSRLVEQELFFPEPAIRRYGCTVSIPWFGEHTDSFFDKLVEALGLLGPDHGRFRFFVGGGDLAALRKRLESFPHCSAERFGTAYAEALCGSRSAVVFGGYNSVIDTLAAGVPALVVLRNMQDQEQQSHLAALTSVEGNSLSTVAEDACSVEQLYRDLSRLMSAGFDPMAVEIELGGAEKAASTLASML